MIRDSNLHLILWFQWWFQVISRAINVIPKSLEPLDWIPLVGLYSALMIFGDIGHGFS